MAKHTAKKKKKVFVSGTYDILHAGHIQFFKDARALGDHLTVCVASDAVVRLAKHRIPAIPEDNRRIIVETLSCVDEAVMSSDIDPVFDFKKHILTIRPDILAVTEDDSNVEKKRAFLAPYGIEVVVLKKRPGARHQTSTTAIRATVKDVQEVPLRIDFAGGWLDVPKYARRGGFIVNCTITPKVSLSHWPYEKGAGLGGSAAFNILKVKSGVATELAMGVGWQDPAVISETGLCVWRSGKLPVLDAKYHPEWLEGHLLIVWQGKHHVASDFVDRKRDFKMIMKAGAQARKAVASCDVRGLAKAVTMSYAVQLGEGMKPLADIKGALAKKYLGAGHGGYALYLFSKKSDRDAAARTVAGAKVIEPYIRQEGDLLRA
jgi:cytidyltransferase-like protein